VGDSSGAGVSPSALEIESLLSHRARSVEVSGIRRVFDLARSLKDPVDLSIGQPDFPAPEAIKRAAIDAIEQNRNGYTPSTGVPDLRDRAIAHIRTDLGWPDPPAFDAMVSSGTLGALVLAFMALLDPGDEIILPDPHFVAYPHLAHLLNARPVLCDTYPDFRMTAERIEPLLGERTKAVLVNSPSNPAGTVLTRQECRDLRDLCRHHGVLLISDEIYDEFVFDDARDAERGRAPSPCQFHGAEEETLLVRGFGKTYGVTGWRMGYAAGPPALISEMVKCQQYTFVCAPSIAQWGCLAAFDAGVADTVRRFQRRRDMVVEKLAPVAELPTPGGAFFAFVKVPESLGMTAQEACERAAERSLLVIPGNVFSQRDTHVRLSFAAPEDRLERGLDILASVLRGE